MTRTETQIYDVEHMVLENELLHRTDIATKSLIMRRTIVRHEIEAMLRKSMADKLSGLSHKVGKEVFTETYCPIGTESMNAPHYRWKFSVVVQVEAPIN